jgi:DNA-binding transcriptional ArsR family regulator
VAPSVRRSSAFSPAQANRSAGPRMAACARATIPLSFNIMVESLDMTFAALAHPTRRDILARLALGETSVGDIAGTCDNISLNAVSKHVMALENAGMVSRRIEWRTHYLSINPEPLRAAAEWFERYRAFWEHRLDALERFLAQKKGAKHGQRNPPDPKNRRHSRRGV